MMTTEISGKRIRWGNNKRSRKNRRVTSAGSQDPMGRFHAAWSCDAIESIWGRVLACAQGVRAALRPIKGRDFTPLYLASALSIPLASESRQLVACLCPWLMDIYEQRNRRACVCSNSMRRKRMRVWEREREREREKRNEMRELAVCGGDIPLMAIIFITRQCVKFLWRCRRSWTVA